MSLLASILIGIIIGGGVGFFVLETIDSLLINTIIGLVGSVIGLVLFMIFRTGTSGISLISWRGTMCSILSAVILLIIFNGAHRVMPKRVAGQSTDSSDLIDED